ncbi:hypothetical protein F511_14952 [Dorcoceras hygrometricum]|uniref:RBR-type E3 ubiquitin transferase n=1 Tax=Dorcoceras hygrometricum TaxID=472368 RepID=A0A2Z7AJU8_9LAMI|nr:hypothetical protein F511_14952 [Dorcoceras hygrometricum]
MEELSSLFDKVSVSDTNYAEELQLQEVLDASLHIYNNTGRASSSSSWSKICCKICYDDDKEEDDMFRFKGCSHSFCSDCVSRHVGAKLQENIVLISCPGEDCTSAIDLATVRSIIPKNVAARWEEALSESSILASKRCTCPHCSEILLVENEEGDDITISLCPFCRKSFCLQCNVPWHLGKSCEEFRILDEDQKGSDELRRLALDKEWKECPNCNIFVEKTEGCRHMTCRFVSFSVISRISIIVTMSSDSLFNAKMDVFLRCKFEFCYLCGSKWSSEHWNCKEEDDRR